MPFVVIWVAPFLKSVGQKCHSTIQVHKIGREIVRAVITHNITNYSITKLKLFLTLYFIHTDDLKQTYPVSRL